MITDKQLIGLGLPILDNGYYWINDNLSVDVEGIIRFESEHFDRMYFIGKCNNIDDLKNFIKIAAR